MTLAGIVSKLSHEANLKTKGLVERLLDIPLALPLISGLLLVVIQPPVSLGFLAWVALIPLLHALNGKRPLQGFTLGLITGIVSYFGLIYWTIVAMNKYGGINLSLSFLALLLLVLYLSLYLALFGFSLSYLQHKLSVPSYLSAPLLWVLLEYLRGVLLSGFPWSFLAHSQHNFLSLIRIASLTGTYFISFLLVAVNCAVYGLLLRSFAPAPPAKGYPARPPGAFRETVPEIWTFRIYVTIVSLMTLSSIMYGIFAQDSKTGQTKRVAIIQGNIAQDVRWDDSFKLKTLKTYCTRTLDVGKGYDLIVWPETALPLVFTEEVYVKRLVKTIPSVIDSYLALGTLARDNKGRFYNTAYVLGPGGEECIYKKVHLVPFGEYTPCRTYLSFLDKMSVANGEFFPGRTLEPVATGVGKLGMLICYEGIFPDISRETVRKGAQVLINMTNDAWYDNTSAPYQHLAFYVFRAVETDRYVIRSSNTGISSIIDPRGRIVKKAPMFTEASLKGEFVLKDSKTFYVKHGDYFILLSLIALVALCIIGFLTKRGTIILPYFKAVTLKSLLIRIGHIRG